MKETLLDTNATPNDGGDSATPQYNDRSSNWSIEQLLNDPLDVLYDPEEDEITTEAVTSFTEGESVQELCGKRDGSRFPQSSQPKMAWEYDGFTRGDPLEDELDYGYGGFGGDKVASNYLDAGEGEIANTENLEETTQAEAEVAQEVLAGALMGDFNNDPTFWSDVGQIVTGLIPIAGQLGDARDLIHALDDITNEEGYKKLGSWATLVLIVIGFVPGVGDAIKSVGKRGIRYLDNNRITKRIGEWLGDIVIVVSVRTKDKIK